jgi:HEAT repeat protein
MAKDRVERRLEQLKTLQSAGCPDDAISELRAALNDRVNVIVAKAAALAELWQQTVLLPELLRAFERLFVRTPESDPQCWGKNAIAKALKNLGCAESAIFLRGLHHRQWESVWGGKTDTAGVLRGTCALALVQCTDLPRYETLLHLIDGVIDAEPQVRSDAARALEQMGGRDVALLLRLKAGAGDAELRVTGQVLEAVLRVESADGVAFVAGFLQQPNAELREEAALALGASRLQAAVEVLKDTWVKQGARGEPALLRAISVSRLDAALEFLLDLVGTGRLPVAEEALRALDLHRDSGEIVKRVAEAASRREELMALFRERFLSA